MSWPAVTSLNFLGIAFDLLQNRTELGKEMHPACNKMMPYKSDNNVECATSATKCPESSKFKCK